MFHKLRNNIDKILINIVSLHMIRSVYYRIISCYSDDECYRTFVDEMNADSKRMGLTNSFWANASGLLDNEREAYTTANDVAKLGVIAYRQGKINPFWNLKYYTCTIQKPYILSINNIKTIRVISTIPYEYIGGKYKILGAKTGTGDGYNGLLCLCDIGNGIIISGSILDAETEELRFEAMKELMDISYNIVNKIPTDGRNIVKNAKMACAYLLDMNGVEECIFMQNADIKYPPMSLTKVLAFMTMSKFIDNYNEWILIKPFDEKNNDIIKKWCKLQLSSLIKLSLLPSCCTASDALARYCGNIIKRNHN